MEIIQDTLNGNPRAQEILYEKYKKSVKNFLKNKYSSYIDLDDDVSEILIKVFMNLHNFDASKSKFRTWVFSIAKNHMVDKWRGNAITLTGNSSVITVSTDGTTGIDISSEGGYTTSNTASINMNSNTFTTCCAGLEFENCSSISYISDQLSPQDFTMLDMKYVQGYSYNEIGSEFNVTSSTISNKVNYIKTKLKKNNPEIIYE